MSLKKSTSKMGGIGPNADRLLPVVFGECRNITPILHNPVQLTYAVHRKAAAAKRKR